MAKSRVVKKQQPTTKPKAKAKAAAKAKPAKKPGASVADSWARIDAWFAAHPDFDPKLRPGATEKQIAAAEKALGVRFPDDFRASLAIHDGQDDDWNCHWLSYAERLGSLQALVACWKDDRQFFDEDNGQGYEDDRVLVHFNHPKHIPIAGSTFWDYDRLLLDLAPGPKGTLGQVVARIDIEFELVAPSFARFLDKVAKRIEKKGGVTPLE